MANNPIVDTAIVTSQLSHEYHEQYDIPWYEIHYMAFSHIWVCRCTSENGDGGTHDNTILHIVVVELIQA